jgi:hypothetical protein
MYCSTLKGNLVRIAETEAGVRSTPRGPVLAWIAAHGIGALLLTWIALANGYPLLFSDSGGYLRVATEFRYLLDRPITYGLMIAPFVRLLGLWSVAGAQALFATWLIGQVLVAVTMRRSAVMLIVTIAVLAVSSSLPWFTGQVMPDLFTSLLALTLYLLLFAPGTQLRVWLLAAVATGLIALHLSHIPLAAALIVTGGAVLFWQDGGRAAVRGVIPALAALLVAILGLCTVSLIVVDSFRPSLESNQFLVARTFDGGIGQPVLARICRTETWRLCRVRGFVDDPRRPQPGQDYLWAADSPRAPLEIASPVAFRAEEGAFARRVLHDDPGGTLRIAVLGWRDQLIDARAADGMVAYRPRMLVVQQIHRYFSGTGGAFDTSRQQRGVLQRLAIAPDRVIALLMSLAAPVFLWAAIRHGDRRMTALVVLVLVTVVANAAICGILSGPADRYQSRIVWLLVLIGIVGVERCGRTLSGRARSLDTRHDTRPPESRTTPAFP